MEIKYKTYRFISASNMPSEVEEVVDDVNTDIEQPAKVILFNDEWHTFDEVINQILKAVKCTRDKAELLTLEVHNTGKACVFEGEMSDCLSVSSILEEIALHTQIEF
ncbi:MAG: ATP-dependent Clp protease adaptor ClpS [Candidatus Kapabacteria bacterium]|nr:ATP-dependent Clp protease adaptor ClpS [Candidatus Kapabacteria bacterium]